MNKTFRFVKANKSSIAAGLMLGTLGAANAADPDTTAIVAAGASVAVVGAAVFVVKVGTKVWSWFGRVL